MKKDKEWLKGLINEEGIVVDMHLLGRLDSQYWKNENIKINKGRLFYLIDQLDEPEILSEEWIDENEEQEEMYGSYGVPVHKLQNLLVPKQEITFEQVHDKLREESILSEKSFDNYWNCINDNVEIDEPGNIPVTKQDKPLVPQFVAEWIEKQMKFGYEDVFISMTRLRERAPEKVKFWFRNNSDTYARAWLDGYEVEKEKKYQVIIRDGEYMMLYLCKRFSNVTIGTNDDYIEKYPEVTHLTEQEIKDYDERFWVFAEEVTE